MHRIDHIDAEFDGVTPIRATVTYTNGSSQTFTDSASIVAIITDFARQLHTTYRAVIINPPQELNIQYRGINPRVRNAGTNPPAGGAGTTPPAGGTGTNPPGGTDEDEDEDVLGSGRRSFWKTKTGKVTKFLGISALVTSIVINLPFVKKNIDKFNPFAKSYKQGNSIVTDEGEMTRSYTGDQALEASSNMVMLKHRLETISNETELLQVLKEINKLVSTHITEVGNLLENGVFGCQPYELHLEDLFEPGTIDYAVVQDFSALRDKVVVKRATALSNGKNESTITKFNNSTTNYYNGYANYAFDGFPWSDDIYVKYLDLSPVARYCIDALTLQMFSLSVPYSFGEWDKDVVKDEVQNNLSSDVEFIKQERGIGGKHQ